jgi:hypothetical protein
MILLGQTCTISVQLDDLRKLPALMYFAKLLNSGLLQNRNLTNIQDRLRS